MKYLIVTLMLLMQTKLYANELTHFVCGSDNNSKLLGVHFGGPRYADWITIDLRDHIKSFLSEEEAGLNHYKSQLVMATPTESCKANPVGKVLLNCVLEDTKWSVGNLYFTYTKKDNNWGDTITVHRRIGVNRMELQVIRQGDIAVLNLSLNVDLPHQNDVEIKVHKELATLNHSWNMCKFESRPL